MTEEDDRKDATQHAPQPELCEADHMTILVKKKAQHLKGVDGNVLDAEYTTKKHAVRKSSKVNTWMEILSKEDIPQNSYYVGEHGEEPEYVLKFISVLRGIRTPGKRYLLNLSLCALCLKWKYANKRGATSDADKEYESSYVSMSIRTMFGWMNDHGIGYKSTEFNKSESHLLVLSTLHCVATLFALTYFSRYYLYFPLQRETSTLYVRPTSTKLESKDLCLGPAQTEV
jgi:hypothetical protein